MAATLDPASATEPVPGPCQSCGAGTLLVAVDDDLGVPEIVTVDPLEVLPRMRCPRCAANQSIGNVTAACWRCRGSRTVGEELPAVGVAVAADGSARWWRGGLFAEGEGLYRLHRC